MRMDIQMNGHAILRIAIKTHPNFVLLTNYPIEQPLICFNGPFYCPITKYLISDYHPFNDMFTYYYKDRYTTYLKINRSLYVLNIITIDILRPFTG